MKCLLGGPKSPSDEDAESMPLATHAGGDGVGQHVVEPSADPDDVFPSSGSLAVLGPEVPSGNTGNNSVDATGVTEQVEEHEAVQVAVQETEGTDGTSGVQGVGSGTTTSASTTSTTT